MSSSPLNRCELCDGTGLEYVPEKGAVRPCSRKCWEFAVFRASVPPRYWSARITDFQKPAVDEVQRWLSAPKDGLLISGPVGTGKTHLAAAIVWLGLDTGMKIRFRSASDFFAELRDSFQTSSKSEREIMRDYSTPYLLVLDDLGSGSLSDHERRSTLDLLDKRLNFLRPTVVTTNLTLEQVGTRFDERIASRLGSFRVVALTGRDRRRIRTTQ